MIRAGGLLEGAEAPAPPSPSVCGGRGDGHTHRKLEILSGAWRGSVEPQFSIKSTGTETDRTAGLWPHSALPLTLGSSLIHSFIHQTCTKHPQGT